MNRPPSAVSIEEGDLHSPSVKKRKQETTARQGSSQARHGKADLHSSSVRKKKKKKKKQRLAYLEVYASSLKKRKE